MNHVSHLPKKVILTARPRVFTCSTEKTYSDITIEDYACDFSQLNLAELCPLTCQKGDLDGSTLKGLKDSSLFTCSMERT